MSDTLRPRLRMPNGRKQARVIAFRADDVVASVIDAAAARCGLSLSDFVRKSAQKAAADALGVRNYLLYPQDLDAAS